MEWHIQANAFFIVNQLDDSYHPKQELRQVFQKATVLAFIFYLNQQQLNITQLAYILVYSTIRASGFIVTKSIMQRSHESEGNFAAAMKTIAC